MGYNPYGFQNTPTGQIARYGGGQQAGVGTSLPNALMSYRESRGTPAGPQAITFDSLGFNQSAQANPASQRFKPYNPFQGLTPVPDSFNAPQGPTTHQYEIPWSLGGGYSRRQQYDDSGNYIGGISRIGGKLPTNSQTGAVLANGPWGPGGWNILS